MLLFIFFGTSFDARIIEAKKAIISTKRVKTIRQYVSYTYTDKNGNVKTESLKEKVGCGINGCDKHDEDYVKKGLSEGKDIDSIIDCKCGSNLYQIKVPINVVEDGNKIVQQYKTLESLGYYSLQGSCINGNDLYIAFSNKGKGDDNNIKVFNNIKEATSLSAVNLTAIVKLNISNNYTVSTVDFVKGIEQIDDAIKYLGHSNDMAFDKGKLQTTWYELIGSGKRFTIGYIDVSKETKGMATNIGKGKKYKKRSMFGITKYRNNDNQFAVGIREEKSKTIRYVDYYKYKNRPGKKQIKYQYVKVKRLFSIHKESAKSKLRVCQCMTSTKNYIYVNVFKGQKKGNNNAIQIYKYCKVKVGGKKYKKFKYKKTVMVKDPEVIDSSGKRVNTSHKKWEIEGFGHLKKKFYCVIVMPKPDKSGMLTNKQAYLTTLKIK